MLHDPTNAEIGTSHGIPVRPAEDVSDLVVLDAGPAGLATAVYGASERLRTLLLESWAIGGQAGTSSMIRNYLVAAEREGMLADPLAAFQGVMATAPPPTAKRWPTRPGRRCFSWGDRGAAAGSRGLGRRVDAALRRVGPCAGGRADHVVWWHGRSDVNAPLPHPGTTRGEPGTRRWLTAKSC